MRFHLLFVYLLALGASRTTAQVIVAHSPAAAECVQVRRTAHDRALNGRLADAEAALSAGLAAGIDRTEDACTGLILTDMAGLMSVTGRDADAELYAGRAIGILERFYPREDPVFFRPLRTLTCARLEQGNLARARESFARMRSVRVERPEDRAAAHGIAASLLQMEGRRAEAESEYLAALHDREEAGLANTADTGALLSGLANLYIEEERLEDARQALDRALTILDGARDASSWDKIMAITVRGVLRARQGEWQGAERDLRDALSMADRDPSLDPSALRPILTNYAQVLRRNHHRREARGIEARIAALGRDPASSVVDAPALLARSNRHR